MKSNTLEDVANSIDLVLNRGLKLTPHIMIGIAWGQIRGEVRALEMLRGKRFYSLALVVLTPLRKTPMADCRIDEGGVLRVMETAREMFPDSRITLGCAKTWGKMQWEFEKKALELGFDGIAYPSEGLVGLAEEMGYQVHFSETCCALAI